MRRKHRARIGLSKTRWRPKIQPWRCPRGQHQPVQCAYHAMIKPIGSICNLDCTYCYYLHKKDLLGTSNHFRIFDKILETHIRQYIEGQDRSEVVSPGRVASQPCWGSTFSEKVVKLEQKYKKPNRKRSPDEWRAPERRMERFSDATRILSWLEHRRPQGTPRPLSRRQRWQAHVWQGLRGSTDAPSAWCAL